MRLCPTCESSLTGPTNADWLCTTCGFRPASDEGVLLLAPEAVPGEATETPYEWQALTEAERRHFWFRTRARLIAWAIDRHFARATSLLDVGCGAGSILAHLSAVCPRLELTGAEVRLDALRHARTRVRGVELLQLDIRKLPFMQHFDVVCAFDVLEHLDDDLAALRELAKAVRVGGGLIVTVPQHPRLWSRVDEFSGHRRRYRRRELVARVRRAGFSIRRVTSFATLVMPGLLWSRARDRRRRAAFDPTAELRIAPAPNAAAQLLSNIELLTIRAGLSWPAGGSLLVVARRD